MFGLFKKNPAQKLQKQYERLMTEARDLQRSGDIEGFAAKSAEADRVFAELERVRQST